MSKEVKAMYFFNELEQYKTEKEKEKHLKFLKSYYDDVVQFDNKYFYLFKKPRIQTSFCFGYGQNGVTDEESRSNASNMTKEAKSNVKFFISENLKEINNQINVIKFYLIDDFDERQAFYNKTNIAYRYNTQKIFFAINSRNNSLYLDYVYSNEELPTWALRELTKEDLQILLENLEAVRERFVKRLQTYLKRFGLTKINSWSYLSD